MGLQYADCLDLKKMNKSPSCCTVSCALHCVGKATFQAGAARGAQCRGLESGGGYTSSGGCSNAGLIVQCFPLTARGLAEAARKCRR